MDAGITDLPHEVLVYILGLVSSYKDLQHCAQVCHQWRCCAKEVAYQKKKNFIKAVSKFKLTWTKIKDQAENEKLIISKRYSHSAVYDETDNVHSVFVFGGKYFLAFISSSQMPYPFTGPKMFCTGPVPKFDFKTFCAGTKTNFTECKLSFCLPQNVCDCHNM